MGLEIRVEWALSDACGFFENLFGLGGVKLDGTVAGDSERGAAGLDIVARVVAGYVVENVQLGAGVAGAWEWE